MQIFSVGHVSYDITYKTDKYPQENTKTRFKEKDQCVGGSAAISAILLSRWHENVEIIGQVGNDEYGEVIRKELSLNRVGNKYLEEKDSIETSHSLILSNRENGKRTSFDYIPKTAPLTEFFADTKPDFILLDGYETKISFSLLDTYKDAVSILSLQNFSGEALELAKKVNYFICSINDAAKITGIKYDKDNKATLIDIYNKMTSLFNNNIIIYLDLLEGCVYTYNNQIRIMPTIKVKVIDSVASDHIFFGAFAYSIINNYDLEKALKFSNIAKSLSVTRVGGYKSIPTLEEMNEVYEEVK